MLSARATHNLSASTLYEVGVSYNSRASKQYDPDFKDNWRSYTDSAANAAIGYTGFINHWAGPVAYSVIQGFNILNENAPNNAYNINNQNSLGGSFDLTSQVSKTWEMKVGARYDYWTMRNFTINSITGLMSYLYGPYNNAPRDMSSLTPEQYRAQIGKAGSINNYGYDVDGNSVDSGPDAPYHPTFASAYFQNKFEYKDIILNFGLRYEYFNSNSKTFRDPLQPLEDFDVNNDIIDPTTLVDAPAYSFVLPRVSFSMPVTVTTVFYAQYGKYVQLPSLNNLYVGQVALSRTVSPSSRGNAYLTPVGYLMTPERTTSYEMGIRQMLSDNFALTLSGFYKDTRDQLEIRNVVDAQGVALYRAYTNNDFGTIKGLELTLELRRTNRFSAKVNYTLSDARGTGSSPNSGSGIVEQGIGRQINFINPLAFNQTHNGTVLLDYRWPVNEGGPILSGFGGNILFTFNSGHPYTQIKGLSSIGQASAWNVGVYPTTDPRYSYPIEAINSSTTPFVLNVDLNLSKLIQIGKLNLEVFVNVTNLLNTKQIFNVYPTTGNPGDDGWLTNPLAAGYLAIPQYAEFYKAINLDNRYSWQSLVAGRGQLLGGDIYGIPRQIRIGARIEL
jgi:outer membrane receptor protein involved in Fe transport